MIEIKNCPVCGSRYLKKYLETKDYFFTKEKFELRRCSFCCLIFTNPRPSDDKLSRYYKTDKYLSHHSNKFTLISAIYKLVRNINIKNKYKLIKNICNQGDILDIGCGTGELITYLEQQGWNTIGVEPDDDARNFAREKNNVEVYPLSFLEENNNISFDVITMWHVLEHVSDLHLRMRQIVQKLKKDGTLIIAVPNIASLDASFYGPFWAGLDVPRHLYHFNEKSLSLLLQIHKFEIVNKIPMTFDALYVSWLSEKYRESTLPFLKGIIRGLISNRNAYKSKEYSSMIFVVKAMK